MSVIHFGATTDRYARNAHPFVHVDRHSLVIATPEEVALNARALRLWPDDARNRAEWLRAVRVVRATTGGWLLDRRVEKAAP